MEIISHYIREYKKLSPVWKITQITSFAALTVLSWKLVHDTFLVDTSIWTSTTQNIHIPDFNLEQVSEWAWVLAIGLSSSKVWWSSVTTFCDLPYCEQILKLCTTDIHSFEKCSEAAIWYMNE